MHWHRPAWSSACLHVYTISDEHKYHCTLYIWLDRITGTMETAYRLHSLHHPASQACFHTCPAWHSYRVSWVTKARVLTAKVNNQVDRLGENCRRPTWGSWGSTHSFLVPCVDKTQACSNVYMRWSSFVYMFAVFDVNMTWPWVSLHQAGQQWCTGGTVARLCVGDDLRDLHDLHSLYDLHDLHDIYDPYDLHDTWPT